MNDRWVKLPVLRGVAPGQIELPETDDLLVRAADVVYLRESLGRVRARIRGTQEYLLLSLSPDEALALLDPSTARKEEVAGQPQLSRQPQPPFRKR